MTAPRYRSTLDGHSTAWIWMATCAKSCDRYEITPSRISPTGWPLKDFYNNVVNECVSSRPRFEDSGPRSQTGRSWQSTFNQLPEARPDPRIILPLQVLQQSPGCRDLNYLSLYLYLYIYIYVYIYMYVIVYSNIFYQQNFVLNRRSQARPSLLARCCASSELQARTRGLTRLNDTSQLSRMR